MDDVTLRLFSFRLLPLLPRPYKGLHIELDCGQLVLASRPFWTITLSRFAFLFAVVVLPAFEETAAQVTCTAEVVCDPF